MEALAIKDTGQARRASVVAALAPAPEDGMAPKHSTMHLTEQHVQNAVTVKLNELGFGIRSLKSEGQHGVDILARHHRYGRFFLVECKGDPGKSVKSRGSGRETRFLLALGQILTRISPDSGYKYGLAFPDTYRDLITRRVHAGVFKRLDLHVFLVDRKGQVEHLTWRELKAAA